MKPPIRIRETVGPALLARMLQGILVLICVIMSGTTPSVASPHDPALEPYLDFLGRQKTSARDYILGLFKDHDIVILCERDHRDLTQYDLFLSVIRDERFVANVGNVFTEVGVSTLNPELNEFLRRDSLPPDSVDRYVLHFHREADWIPLWEKQNFSYFLRGLYDINRNLPAANKIRLYPSDLAFDWKGMDSAKLAQFQGTLAGRDSSMAHQIIEEFERISKSTPGRTKALVIMNYRHAFGKHFARRSGEIQHNVGAYLTERYGERVANVYVNFAALTAGSSDRSALFSAVQDGKWDAAFQALKIEDVGFDFRASPFGADDFDLWPLRNHSFRFEDVFTGLVYYLPLEKMRMVVGIPGIVDSAFLPELQRREWLSAKVSGEDPSSLVDAGRLMRYYNNEREFKVDGLDSLKAQIDKWLR
jgi:hypothetical protein